MMSQFEDIVEIIDADDIIDLAFRAARRAVNKTIEGDPTRKARRREKKRIRVSSQVMRNRLKRVLDGFPDPEKMHPFYQGILDTLSDRSRIVRIRRSLDKSCDIINQIEREEIKKIGETQNPDKMTEIRQESYGRFSSVINKLDSDLSFLKETKDKIKDIPGIDPEISTVIIAGYPNVGKSTVLNNLTKAKPRVASFPFTTRKIILGHFNKGWRKYQIVDTPGLLDRPFEEMSKPEKQVIHVFRELEGLIIYIFDPTEHCGFSKLQQLELFKSMTQEFSETKFLPLINKEDLILDRDNLSDLDLRKELEELGYSPRFIIGEKNEGINLKEYIDDYFKPEKLDKAEN